MELPRTYTVALKKTFSEENARLAIVTCSRNIYKVTAGLHGAVQTGECHCWRPPGCPQEMEENMLFSQRGRHRVKGGYGRKTESSALVPLAAIGYHSTKEEDFLCSVFPWTSCTIREADKYTEFLGCFSMAAAVCSAQQLKKETMNCGVTGR
ncbi:uncharacterized protein LOC125942837 [Dermacentor silvarum]|uniref:uncharacterized protein LOC125942837 n=1 Tax=Dermacentor silvarum TaxID=543639 RepID=UPI002101AA3B|nr:uncharacterized protein LOC125942837 [Dermacentor silvarum]